MEFDGLIFDMDGVIVDVGQSYRETIRRTAAYFLGRRVNMEEVSWIKNRIGMNNDWDASYELINDKTIPYEKVKNYFQSIYLGDNTRKGLITREKLLITKENLWKLKDRYQKLGIATGRPKEEAQFVISTNKLDGIFNCIVAMEDVRRGKPFPDSINKVIQTLKIRNTVYIGDSPSDVVAAKAARIPSIYIGKEKLGTIRFPEVQDIIKYLL